jgi:hypothetical protein
MQGPVQLATVPKQDLIYIAYAYALYLCNFATGNCTLIGESGTFMQVIDDYLLFAPSFESTISLNNISDTSLQEVSELTLGKLTLDNFEN